MNAAVQTREARAGDGTRLVYAKWGGGGRRIVLLHSLAMDHAFWGPVAARLMGRFEVLAPDCRGHGGSGKPNGPYTVELFARDLAAVMDHAGWESAAVAGCSMGGCVALAFAAAYPARVTALWLIDTTAWYGEGARAAWEERAQKAADGGLATLIGFQKSRWFGDAFREANPGVVEEEIRVFLANDVAAYGETCRMLGACDMRGALAGFRFPARVIVGEEDYAAPVAMAEALRDGIPGATLRVIPKARHLTPLEVPDLIAEELAGLANGTK